jgi:RNA polymerase sigma factor (sigma-70 family)
MSGERHTDQLESLLARLEGDFVDDVAARDALIRHSAMRLEALTRRMLRRHPRLRRWEQTEDVFQNALVRLNRALQALKPETARQYYALATTQIRRELIDLARHYRGPAGLDEKYKTGYHFDGGKTDPHTGRVRRSRQEPVDLEEWAEFHKAVERLPDTERETFQILWYNGMTQRQAAEVLGVSERTVKNRWRNAKLQLRQLLQADVP